MAKAKNLMDLLGQGIKLAAKEHEKTDLINNMANFCESTGKYFNNDIYFNFERSVVDTIEYANSLAYKYDDFENYYDRTILAFLKFKSWYDSLFQNIIMSFPIAAKNPESLESCLSSLFLHPRADVEAVVMDCSNDGEMKEVVDKFQENNIKYFMKPSENEAENQLELLSKCEGIFVFPLKENYKYIEQSYPFITEIILDNPQAGTILSPAYGSERLTKEDCVWESFEPGNDRIEAAKKNAKESVFGYKRELVNLNSLKKEPLASIEDIFVKITDMLCDTHDTVIFCFPLYLTENNDNN